LQRHFSIYLHIYRGAVAKDGRIEPGDMILQVNDTSFENMSNDEAVKVLREAVMKPGPVKLVVAKCWEPTPKGYFRVSKSEPVRPIDPSAWVAHAQAHTGIYPSSNNTNYGNANGAYNSQVRPKGNHHLNYSMSSFGSNSSLTTSIDDSALSMDMHNPYFHHRHQSNNNERNKYGGAQNIGINGNKGIDNTLPTLATTMTTYGHPLNFTVKSDLEEVVKAMAAPDSGLDIRERTWLKITIPNAFIGSDVVDWLFYHLDGFLDRSDARKYACELLKAGYIKHAVHKLRFSEQCYYVFGDLNHSAITNNSTQVNGTSNNHLFTLNEESETDFDSVSELDRDTLYMPVNFPPTSTQPPGVFGGGNAQQKIYSNLNGIGGPPPPPSYMSSSSSNATSNSTSTTSNNTTNQTIATNGGGAGCSIAGNTFVSNCNGSAISTTSSTATYQNNHYGENIATGGMLNMNYRTSACQMYFTAPSQIQKQHQQQNQQQFLSTFSSTVDINSTNDDSRQEQQQSVSQYTNDTNMNPPNSLSQSQTSNATANAPTNHMKLLPSFFTS
jgi:hypothetical protein